ncbi:Dual specificity phosphatase [Pelomyxa schiedti]|nr:Dual specificity phosphatase [Pelomyxa schiedti]
MYSRWRRTGVISLSCILGCLCAYLIATRTNWSVSFFAVCVELAHSTFVLLAVAAAMSTNSGHLTWKRPEDGKIPWLMLLLWAPWIGAQLASLYFKRVFLPFKGLPVISQIHDGLFLGGFPAFIKFDDPWKSQSKLPFDSVLDLTCEISSVHNFGDYLNIPTWDCTAVLPSNIERAVSWVVAHRKAGKSVLIHCCYGVGRSATVMCAVLLRAGVCSTIEEALKYVGARRPQVKLAPYQLATLVEWHSTYHNKEICNSNSNSNMPTTPPLL